MISIITSLYRSEAHLPKFIKNAAKVSRELTKKSIPHEFLIISNEPNFEEKSILDTLKNNSKFCSRIMTCARESLYATWNRGVREAKYNIITFWNVDDVRFVNGIIDGISLIKNTHQIIYFPFIYKRYIRIWFLKVLVKYKTVIPPYFSNQRFETEMHCGPFFMTTKSTFLKNGEFNPTFKIAGDFEWCVRAAKKGITFTKSFTIAGIFTNDGRTLSGSKSDIQKDENDRILGIIKK